MSRIVAIVGRPNVGKSTLFNRITEARNAIVHDTSGVTRDRHYGRGEWNGTAFTIIDTGGYVPRPNDIFETETRKQVEIAIREADLLLFMVDVAVGITGEDEEFAKLMRKAGKPVLVVANKADNFQRYQEVSPFYKFGFDDVIPISSMSGSGTGDLLDAVMEKLPVEDNTPEENPDIPRFAIVGRPNVGKSTFINVLIGEERTIVSEIPGTTRDSIHTLYNKYNKEFYLIDTAGLRKKKNVTEDIEFYSVMRTIKAVEDADVCFVMIDAREGIEAQDINIFSLAVKRRKGVVILVNKWDLAKQEEGVTTKHYTEVIRDKLSPFSDVPVLFISALDKTRIHKALEVGIQVFENRKQRISTPKLNEFLLELIQAFPPPSHRGKYIKIKYTTQVPSKNPAFALFCNYPQAVKESYKRFLENKMREKFDFTGVPLSFYFKKK
ncbi:MAG: ribosome biogenesis GTPase Der [Bacteroidia bacterium]